jgi:DNA polymerase-3 subunit gamma/tau
VIIGNLATIAKAEGAKIDADALTLIAHAAEGSVRDAQSLLDQALVQADAGQTVSAAQVRDMLGLADRAQTIGLFEHTVRGEVGPAIEAFRDLYRLGAEPAALVIDLLEHCHAASVAKMLGPDVLALPKDQSARLAALGSALSAGSLARLWQMLLRAHDEVRRAPAPDAAVEMALIRLAYAADLPGPEEALKALQGDEPPAAGGGRVSGGVGTGQASALAQAPQSAPRARPQAEADLQSFEDVVRMIDARRDVALLLDVEKYVRPISFRLGAIVFEPAPGAPANLATRLAARLKDWTGQPWLVASEGGGGAETLLDRQRREQAAAMADALAEPFVQAMMQTFPGAEIVEIRQMAAPQPAAGDDGVEQDD